MAKATRSTRSSTKVGTANVKKNAPAPAGRTPKPKAIPRNRKVKPLNSDLGDVRQEADDNEEPESDVSRESSDEEDNISLHSDALDDDTPPPKPKKRKRALSSSVSRSKSDGNRSPRKSAVKKKRKVSGEDSDGPEEIELEDGQEIVGVVVQAPKTGRVPPGQISRNTFDFLSELKVPEHNDREWFKLHEPVYRLAEKEWKDFVEVFTELLVEADPQVPPLPPKDVIHRIYRDVRFSNDKTPYKTGFCASFSRSGRKGIFAKYHVRIEPGGNSIIAAGAWQPGKNELATIRNNILRSPKRLKDIISEPAFEKLFGKARPDPKGGRSSVFGFEDELKTAPKGIDKTHKDIALLKCRSLAVVHKFDDDIVLSPDFKDELVRIINILRPFIHCLNDMMTLPPEDSDSDENSDEGGDEEDE
ncbi:hypothetical protein NLI96_g8327 [Meripilus lineatus]|uniref:TIGR02453 family protein n=1 Tax=Meripilus lineatus TaxID=2056292 RepID=A0AAD5UXJ5_9APHY|nr:hypothetical protein NLI96_g8327 [Physisporinus lineatus]